MAVVHVALGARTYDIRIEDGLVGRSGEHLAPLARASRLLVVSDKTVWKIAGPQLIAGLGEIEAVPFLVAAGEQSKSWAGLQSVVEWLLAAGIERSDHIVAFGGGVVGDLAGFAASIVKRGCNFVQIPTSLLAQVDSSVGGKTAIDVPLGKNLVGAFHQPSLVLVDPALLDTLPAREVRAGYAEIVKYALIEDIEFFEWLEREGSSVLACDPAARMHAIRVAIAGKAQIVEQDERESGARRALLNLGHTFGHALEAEAGYSAHLLHGEAVALGCTLAFEFSTRRGLCSEAESARVRDHFAAVGLPTRLEDIGMDGKGLRLARHMEQDKKRIAGQTAFILARGIGRAFVDHEVAIADVAAFLDEAD
ncbi:MAG TPA: 3-dehydroquinate synthase [Sphingomicrobium sp.]|nr:3-dehydroquinate synthase [Sphingomicrobium sp.]